MLQMLWAAMNCPLSRHMFVYSTCAHHLCISQLTREPYTTLLAFTAWGKMKPAADSSTASSTAGLLHVQVRQHQALVAQCVVHVYRLCTFTRRCLGTKRQKQAPLYLAEIHLAFDFLAGSPCG